MAPPKYPSMTSPASLPEPLIRIVEARHHDPFEVLGRHQDGQQDIVRAFLPHCSDARIVEAAAPLKRIENTDLFEWRGASGSVPARYQLAWTDRDGIECLAYDPYCFPPQLGDLDLHLFGEGRHLHAYRFLGAQLCEIDGVKGTRFAVWAPGAERISVVGDWNHWDGRFHPMRARGGSGVWELFIPGVGAHAYYKFEIRNRETGSVRLKTDPYGQAFELRPGTACVTQRTDSYSWNDQHWMQTRAGRSWLHAPMSIYEVHLGSWQRDRQGQFLNYRQLAEWLVNYVKETGFTHVELLPVTEHPFDGSWGYQTTGYFAPNTPHSQSTTFNPNPRAQGITFMNDAIRDEEQFAAFGEFTWHATDQWAVTLGARYYDIETSLVGSSNFATFCSSAFTAYHSAPTWRGRAPALWYRRSRFASACRW